MRQKDVDEIVDAADLLVTSGIALGELDDIGPGIDLLCGQLADHVGYKSGESVDVSGLRRVCQEIQDRRCGY